MKKEISFVPGLNMLFRIHKGSSLKGTGRKEEGGF